MSIDFRNFNLATKISLGFATVTVCLIGVALFAWHAISNTTWGFDRYRDLARESNLCGSLQADMLSTRIQVKNFIINGTEKDVSRFHEYHDKTLKHLDLAKVGVQEPERAEKVSRISKLIGEYKLAFLEVVKQRTVLDKILDTGLNQIGPKLTNAFNDIRNAMGTQADANLISLHGKSMQDLTSARLHVMKYSQSLSNVDRDMVIKNLDSAGQSKEALQKALPGDLLVQSFRTFDELLLNYRGAFDQLVAVSEANRNLIENSLDVLGPEIAKLADEVNLSVEAEQDELGPRQRASNQNAITLILIVSFVVAFASIIIAWILSRIITRPILELADAMAKARANNDLTIAIPVKSRDEVGIMAANFNAFVLNLRETVSVFSRTTSALGKSSQELTQTAMALSSGASKTSECSSQANHASTDVNRELQQMADSAKEMSLSVQSVVASVSQMKGCIQEIASNATNSVTAVDEAKAIAEDSQMKIGLLDQSASEIGKVVTMIREIAEQTNLLALNATIESARAGEAGRGFAVVAGEVKDLAKQTAVATESIRGRVEAIQKATGEAVDSIVRISGVISQVKQVSDSIAAAVEEQSVATADISRNMNDSAQATDRMAFMVQKSAKSTDALTVSISEVDHAAQQAASGATQTRNAGQELSKLADNLQSLIEKFHIG
jgi:methyl-accepting chemotaxis protein